jgi:hypothetical protein
MSGVLFVEGRPPGFNSIGPISSELGDFFTSAQHKSLRDMKEQMAEVARGAGGNCVADFRYGQRSSGFWRSFINRDDMLWYGSGTIGTISEDDAAAHLSIP